MGAALVAGASMAQGAAQAGQILERLASAGLPIGRVTSYDERTDPNRMLGRPNGYLSKADFTDTRYPDLRMAGTLEVFPTVELSVARQRYIDDIGRRVPALAQYMYRNRRALLRLERDLLPSEAEAYAAAFRQLTI